MEPAVTNIFAGLKVVDFASFVAGPGAAVILADFGADVIKIEPPNGDPWRIAHKVPPQPRSGENYTWQLNNRNKRSLVLDLKSKDAHKVVERLAKWADVFIVNTPHAACQRLQLTYEDVSPCNPRLIYADITGYGDEGPDAALPGFDITAYWARSGLLALTRDAGAPPTLPIAGSGDHATAVGLFSSIVMGLYQRERTGQGAHVTTSLLASGVWACGVPIQAALCDAKFYPLHDRTKPPNPSINVYRTSDGQWFVLVATPSKWPSLARAIGQPELLTDPRFAKPADQAGHATELAAIFDRAFASKPMAFWSDAFKREHVTFSIVQTPEDVVNDRQLRDDQVLVPITSATGKLRRTITSPIKVHGVTKELARRAPDIGEHSDEVLAELGFDADQIAALHSSGVTKGAQAKAAGTKVPRVAGDTGEQTHGRLFVLDLSGGRVLSMLPDGSDERVLVSGCRWPDGIAVDPDAGCFYWTNMGDPEKNDGSIERADLDGRNRCTIVPPGATFTPKQIHLEKSDGKLYWADREGMRVMRCNVDGTAIETLVEAGHGDRDRADATRWCVGIAVDAERGYVYWSQKGPDNAAKGRILRAGLNIRPGESPVNRSDIEVLFDGLPEPIDLEFDVAGHTLFWTDRGDPPSGNTLNRASIDGGGQHAKPSILLSHLMEGIGLALDAREQRVFVTDLGGSIYTTRFDGSDAHMLSRAKGNLTGIAYADLSTPT